MWGSPWVGLKHFERFINGYQFWTLFKNTLGLSAYQLIAGFPMPILMALIVNQVTNMKVKKTVQTITYAPHFISTVVLVGMLFTFLSPRSGFINKIIAAFGGEPIFFMASAQWFKTLYVLSGIWQNAGWGMIIYLAALSNVDTGLYDAAMIDGANRFQRVIHIDIPSIIPTAIMLLILNMGRVMSVGFEKAFLMQTPANLESAEIISTYVYKVGLLNAQFSFSTAVGLFNSVINLILIIVVNSLARKYSETSLW
jgi:putative aldouronate transport system permease protein